MPVRNAALYLEECLDSIIKQDFDDWELIAVNDHSTDDTPKILSNYQYKDKRIKYVDNIGKGIIDGLQTGYGISQGEFITRMDADDRMSADKLSQLYHLLIENGAGYLATGHVKYFSDNILGDGYKRYEAWLNQLCDNNTHFNEIYKECVIPSPCWMVSRIDFEKVGAFDSNIYPEDYDLCFRFYQHQLKVVSTNQILHEWRDYEIRSSRTDDNYKDNRFLNLKTQYFLSLDQVSDQLLFLWGAGKKAKKVAQLLIEQKVSFRWISNNINKIGKDIYGVIIENESSLISLKDKEAQVIIAIANEEEKKEIRERIDQNTMIDTYYFS